MPAIAATTASRFTTTRTFRWCLWVHRWASLVVTPFFFVPLSDGTVLIFHEEIDAALGYTPDLTHPDGTPLRPLRELVDIAQATVPTKRPLWVYSDPEHYGRILVSLADPGVTTIDEGQIIYLDGVSGAVLPSVDHDQTPTGFLFHLHAEWFLGRRGELIGGVIGFLVLASIISSLVVYAPYAKRVAFGVLRRGKGVRLFQLDLHNFVGVAVLGWLTIVSVTGFCLAFGSLAHTYWQDSVLPAIAANYTGTQSNTIVSPDSVRRSAEGTQAGWHAHWIVYPGTELSSPRHYNAILFGPQGVQKRLQQSVMIDASTGELTAVLSRPLYLDVMNLAGPLHFGDYGGWPLKVFWCLCAWLTLFIVGNGAWLWWIRRVRRGRARDKLIVGDHA